MNQSHKEFTLFELNYSIFLKHMVGNKNKKIYNVKAQRVLTKYQCEQRNKKKAFEGRKFMHH